MIALAAWAIEALAASALLIALVLLVRVPVRRAFGAPVAYALWALPVLRLVLPPLPAAVRARVVAPLADTIAAPFTEVGQQVTILIAPAAADNAAASSPITAGMTLAMLWGLGAAAFLAWHLLAYRRFRRRLLAHATPLDRVDGVTIVTSEAAAGPLAFGVARRFVAFPRDFAERYGPDERALALAHELGHHQRGDLAANWIALAVLALHWFNPLAWYAFRAFRADQEMANDAGVLARLGTGARHAYACAIVKAAHGGAIAAACHLHTVNDLKGRLKMLGRRRASRARALCGMAAVAAAGTGALALTASGTQAAARVRAEVAEAADIAATALAVPVAAATGAVTAEPKKDVRVVIVRDGTRRIYEGDEAEAWIAANPPPAPPAPPAGRAPAAPGAPPLPPTPPTPPADRPAHMLYGGEDSGHRVLLATGPHGLPPEVREATCPGDADRPLVIREDDGGQPRVTICTNRIARVTAEASRHAAEVAHRAVAEGGIRLVAARVAARSALSGMRAAQTAIAVNDRLSPAERDRALANLDREIARREKERTAPE